MSRKICSLGIRTLSPEYVRTRKERLYPLDHLGKHLKKIIFLLYGDGQFSCIFFLGFRVELNL